MKKIKFNFGEGGFQGFLIQHVEKCVLGAIVLLVGWLIISGSSAPSPLDPRITKEALKQNANDADQKILTSDWEKIAPTRKPASNVQEEVTKRIYTINSNDYYIPTYNPGTVPDQTPRKDPRLIAAENVRVTPLFGPLAIKTDDAPGGVATRRPDEDRPREPIDKLPVSIRTSGVGYGRAGEEETAGDEEKTDKKIKPKPAADKKKGKGGDNPYGSEGPGPGSGPDYLAAQKNSQTRTVPPDATQGIRPKDAHCKVVPAYAMVVTATVPFDKQWRAFEEAFSNAPGGQNPKRDLPTYMAVWVKRADVTDDPDIDPAKIKEWTQITNTSPISTLPKVTQKNLRDLEAAYGAVARERSDDSMLDGYILHPVPPFLLTNLKDALLHPEIPLATEEELAPPINPETPTEPGANPPGVTDPGSPDDPSSALGADGRPQPGRFNNSTMKSAVSPLRRPSTMSGDGKVQKIDYADGFDLTSFKPPAKKMVRFVDYDVKPGRKYRYKVQLVLRDPNHPRNPNDAPDITSLDDKTRERVKKLDLSEAETKRRVYWVITPESAPSEVASFPVTEHFYAGEATQAKEISLKDLKVPGGEPAAKVLSVVWDPRIATFVPAEKTVRRASFLAGKVDAEVIHPILGDVRKWPGYNQTTDALVLDIYGGDLLPGVDPRSPVRAPGSTLLLDRNGKLVVTDEVADVDAYHRFFYPEPKQESATSNSPAADAAGMGESVLDIPGFNPGKKGAK